MGSPWKSRYPKDLNLDVLCVCGHHATRDHDQDSCWYGDCSCRRSTYEAAMSHSTGEARVPESTP